MSTFRGLQSGIYTALQHREWLCKEVTALYGEDVGCNLEPRLRERLGGVRRLRQVGLILSMWNEELGPYLAINQLKLAGLRIPDLFAGVQINDSHRESNS